ncbi:MAG: asparagine synthase (glutamine-hydrolyzing) [Candidatus Peribacteraceae bacterium]
MCGIAGFIGEDRPKIEAITRALVHRGPDGNACEVGHGISLGHARLAILDPRPEGNQPMWNDERSVVIVYNGEIFNYRELKNREGFSCKTTTDTEVLLQLYERYGMAFIPRLRGMFAFAIYDTKSSTLHLARDSSGIKPLYLTYVDGKPYFASEMRALMRGLDRRPDLNLEALSLYLRLQYVPGPQTLAKGIESVPPGTVISWSQDTEKRFWMEPDTPKITIGSKKQAATDLPTLMQRIVTDHLISDKPVGVFLSGGMDSSIILHHMAAAINGPIKTFTVRFEATEEEDARRFNRDADLARLTASDYGTDHEELLLTAEDFRRLYRSTACALDLPNADSVSVAQYALAAKAKKKVDVVLCGAGGDELFGGYPRYRVARILEFLRFLPAGVRSFGGKMFGYPPDVLAMSPGPALAERLLARPIDEGCAVTRGDWFDPAATTRLFIQRFGDEKGTEPLRQFMEMDRHLWLVDESLKLADAVTMASGLECRVPFLDPRIIAFSHGTPAHWHVGLQRTKAFLKDTYRHILPEHLFTLPKSSFYPPLAKWLRRESGPLVEEMLEGKRIREFFDVERVREIYDRHCSRERYGLSALSTLIQLHNWFETVYDAPP